MSNFLKDIPFIPLASPNQQMLEGIAQAAVESIGAAGFWRMATLLTHSKHGNQMWVSREVSDDLQASTIVDPDFGILRWPHPQLEVFFEDPNIPSFLLTHGTRQELVDRYWSLAPGSPGMDLKIVGSYTGDDPLIELTFAGKDQSLASVCFNVQDMNAFAACGVDAFPPAGEALLEDEQREIHRCAVLAFKLLLFCNSEGLGPRMTFEPPTRKQGGKPGFKNRPKTRRLVVEYLPHHRDIHRTEASQERALAGREFNGRHGHFRTFRDPRFVNVVGTTRFIRPIAGPDGKFPQRQFRVVKPKG